MKEDYLELIKKHYNTTAGEAELVYNILIEDKIKGSDIRDAAIVMKFDNYMKSGIPYESNPTYTSIHHQLCSDFEVEYYTVRDSIYRNAHGKSKIKV